MELSTSDLKTSPLENTYLPKNRESLREKTAAENEKKLVSVEEIHFNKEELLSSNKIEMADQDKINIIADHIKSIMLTLGLDVKDESLCDTPIRVAKMYVNETFKGLNPANKPVATLFSNNYKYNQMLIEKDITIYSTCEHHLVPIIGKAHIAYYSNNHVIGLSKLNRIADYFARRPQVQERLTIEIAEALKEIIQTEDVAVMIEAQHLCVASRGIRDTLSSTITAEYTGKFLNPEIRNEFLSYIGRK